MTRLIVNIVGFQAGWFACILGAAHGMVWLGPIVVVIVLGVNLALNPSWGREIASLVAIAAAGTAIDTGLHLAGLLTFDHGRGPVSWVFVPWIGALWLNFAATLSVSMRWLTRLPVLAIAAIGVASGPGTYALGVRLGALGFHEQAWISLAALAIEWAIALPGALWLSRRIHRHGADEHSPEEGASA